MGFREKLAAAKKKIAAGEGKNPYIVHPEKALELISLLVRNSSEGVAVSAMVRDLKRKVGEIFKLFSELSVPGETEYYRRFMMLCDKAMEQNKVRSLRGRTVISLGGRFSSGKSSLINAFSDMGDLLPVEQTPTTSIPTYLVAGDHDSFTANSYYGFGTMLPKDAVEAISHDFADTHKIQLAAFVESIVITAAAWKLPPQIALLDTPGYNKPETGNDDVRAVQSDRLRAREQLKKTDYLIWLADITNGTLTLDDFEFINRLGITNPILIIFNKADKVDDQKRLEVVGHTRNDLEKHLGPECFGVAAYSSTEKKEYDGDLINGFFNMVAQSGCHCNDFYAEVVEMENGLRQALDKLCKEENDFAEDLARNIVRCDDGRKLLTGSLVRLWGRECRSDASVSWAAKEYQARIEDFNTALHKIIDRDEK